MFFRFSFRTTGHPKGSTASSVDFGPNVIASWWRMFACHDPIVLMIEERSAKTGWPMKPIGSVFIDVWYWYIVNLDWSGLGGTWTWKHAIAARRPPPRLFQREQRVRSCRKLGCNGRPWSCWKLWHRNETSLIVHERSANIFNKTSLRYSKMMIPKPDMKHVWERIRGISTSTEHCNNWADEVSMFLLSHGCSVEAKFNHLYETQASWFNKLPIWVCVCVKIGYPTSTG